MRIRAYVWLVATLAFAAAAWGQVTQRSPHIGYAYPAGGQEGTSVEVTVGGQMLRGVTDVYVTGAGVHASVIKYYAPNRNLMPEQRQDLVRRLVEVRDKRLAELGLRGRVAPIPGEATGILGGYLFGTGVGFLCSTIGLTLGSILAFGLGRWLGLPLVRRLVSEKVYHRFDFISRTGGELVTLVCFLIPGFPKDYLCFLLGVSPLQFGVFLVICTFGRMPGTWLLSIQGAKVRSAQYTEFVIYLLVAAAAAVLGYIYRDAIFRWMHRRHGTDGVKGSSDRLDL